MADELPTYAYAHEGLALTGRLARPEGNGPFPAVLVMHDAIGLGRHVQESARRLAALGYVALCADMYGDAARTGDPQAYVPCFMALQGDPEKLRARVVAAYDTLLSLPGVDTDRTAAIGYCFGGQCVLELARSGAAARSVVSLHGLLTTRLPAAAGDVAAKMLVLTGALDPYVPVADVAGFQQEMTEAGADWQVTVYGSGWHAFTDPDVEADHGIPGVRYDPLLDRLSWAATTAYLDATTA